MKQFLPLLVLTLMGANLKGAAINVRGARGATITVGGPSSLLDLAASNNAASNQAAFSGAKVVAAAMSSGAKASDYADPGLQPRQASTDRLADGATEAKAKVAGAITARDITQIQTLISEIDLFATFSDAFLMAVVEKTRPIYEAIQTYRPLPTKRVSAMVDFAVKCLTSIDKSTIKSYGLDDKTSKQPMIFKGYVEQAVVRTLNYLQSYR